uniref:Nudix hydrolase domain-containing protein n=1 Tax=viral metagenome TaxID=1070528 RepID=A0A6C0LKQ9_9ZZZZ
MLTNDRHKNRPIKRSVGIIIFNYEMNSVLLVQKKCTYAFSEFVIGRYDKNNKNQLIEKLNKMTTNEKVIIHSMEFEWMWYNMFMSKDKSDHYCRAFGRFFKYFLNNQRYLKNLLSQSTKNTQLLWEPPKGRKLKTESSFTCALREVTEETKLNPNSYRIIPNKKIKKQLISNNTKYIMVYYIAVMKKHEHVRMTFSDKSQPQEISEISWVNINNLKNYNMMNDIRQSIILNYRLLKEEMKSKHTIRECVD